jgi:hypothetical protein
MSHSLRVAGAILALLLIIGRNDAAEPSPEQDFGAELPITCSLGLGGAMDATVAGNMLYVIGRGHLHVADISEPEAPTVVGRLTDLGNARQIEIHHGVAYITAREDGLFVVDVTKPDVPVLLCHYDTIELATGIALSGNVAYVACRTAGVELVDVTNPRRLRHLSTVRTGEAQSVVARNGILYVGVWGSRELVVCDVTDPYRPAVISRTPLDGNGDGVAVRGRYCFVATGHHTRGWTRNEGEASPLFGAGHGLEVFDMRDPAQPVFVSRVKTRRFYRIGMDMWDVMIAGNYAFLGDTYNGVFVLDISDIQRPRFVGHRQLAPVPRMLDGLDTGECLPAPVGGIALARDSLYVASPRTGLHVMGATGLAQAPDVEPDKGTVIPEKRCASDDANFRVYQPGGQVHGVAFSGDMALVAAGEAGLHAVRLWPDVQRRHVVPTNGFARDVAVHKELVYVAEAAGGLSIWKRDDLTFLKPVSQYHPENGGVAQVVVPPPGCYALLHVGRNELQILDVTEPRNPRAVLTDRHLGLFYTFGLSRELLDNRYATALWHVSGYRWYDLYGGAKPTFSGDHFKMQSNFADGMTPFEGQALLVSGGKIALVPREEKHPLENAVFHGVNGTYLSGKPTVDGSTLYLSNRVRGTVTVVDITRIESPRLLAELQLDEHPGPVVVHNGIPVIPAGYQGLLVWKRPPLP